MLIDVAATAERRGPDLTLIEELTREVFVPITVGGGVRRIDDVRALMRAGADKVLIGAAWRERPKFLCEAADKFGAQAIVASVDSRGITLLPGCAVGEILLNAVDRDGTMEGYDLRMIATVALQVDCPLIACGGCSGYEDMRRAIRAGASAVAAGALFQFTDATPRGAAEYLKANGVEART